MDPKPEPLGVQVFDLADQLLDLGAELLALREVIDERGIALDDRDVLLRTLRLKAKLSDDHQAVSGRILAMERSKVEELLALGDGDPAA